MRISIAGLVAGLFVFTGCSSTGDPVFLDAEAGGLSLTELIVDSNLKAAVPYAVALRYQGDASNVRQVCFMWSGEGPFCWSKFSVTPTQKLIQTQAVTRNPKSSSLTGFVRYGGGNTNRVSKTIKVTR